MGLEHDCKGVVLFADDSKTARAAAAKVLQEKYTVIDAPNGDLAWEKIKENPDIAFVFADIHMPVSNGLELLSKIRSSSDSRIASLPVVVITGIENSEAAMRVALNMGATDFISKPFKAVDLLSRTYSYITLNNKIKMLEADVTRDKVTGFYLTNQFESYARKSLSFANRYKNSCSFAYIEIDTLSEIYLQHSKGILNQILELMCKRITGLIREEDFIAQLSTNCFGLILPATGHVKTGIVIKRILSSLDKLAFDIGDENYRLDARVAVFTNRGFDNSYEDVVCELDAALTKGRQERKKIVTCGETDADKGIDILEVKDSALNDALIHVLNGDYHKILDNHVRDLSAKLGPFMNYANAQNFTENFEQVD